MDGPRDITDEFDDDALRASIQKADKDGQWRDAAQSAFVDPKLEALRKQLSEPARETYTARRMRELQKQSAPAAAKSAPQNPQDARAREQAALESVFADADEGAQTDGWRAPAAQTTGNEAAELEGLAATGPRPSAQAPTPNAAPAPKTAAVKPAAAAVPAPKTAVVKPAAAVVPAPKVTPARPQSSPLAAQLRLVIPGLLVFAAVALLQLGLTGWRYDLLLRVPVAGALAGLAWRKFDAGWLRSGAIGGAVHLLTFFATSLAWSTRDITANAFGLLAAVIGSCLVGWIRKANDGASKPGKS